MSLIRVTLCCRVCELLQSGAVMNKSYQPHEGHIPYLLQLFIDYNLYGMNLVNLGAVKFRRGPSKGKEQKSLLVPRLEDSRIVHCHALCMGMHKEMHFRGPELSLSFWGKLSRKTLLF